MVFLKFPDDIETENGYTYEPEQLQQGIIIQKDLEKELATITIKMVLINMKIKSIKKNKTIEGIDDLYIINKEW